MPYFAVHGSLFLFFFKALLTKVEKLHGHNSKSAATRHCAFFFEVCEYCFQKATCFFSKAACLIFADGASSTRNFRPCNFEKKFKIAKRLVLGWAFVEYTHSNHHLIIGMSVAKGLSGSSSSVLFKKEEEERILRSGAREDVTLVLLFCSLLTAWNHILVTRKNWIY